MIYRTLGRTGERVSAIGLGGWHIGQPFLSEQESIQLIGGVGQDVEIRWRPIEVVDRGCSFINVT
jgi:aryl-alcohol dehydrogenase-like predicted oxidoreductase